jgi:hypothetical protein
MKQGVMVRLKVNPDVMGSVSAVEPGRFRVTWRPVWHEGDRKASPRQRVWYDNDNKFVERAVKNA